MDDRFTSILKLAEGKENDAARDFIQARDNWAYHQSKLDELRAYRDEYAEPGRAVSPQQFQSTRTFLSQLSIAIDAQEAEVARSQVRRDQEEAEWLASRVKRKSIETLTAKRQAAAEKLKDKREQQEMDELSQRSRPLR